MRPIGPNGHHLGGAPESCVPMKRDEDIPVLLYLSIKCVMRKRCVSCDETLRCAEYDEMRGESRPKSLLSSDHISSRNAGSSGFAEPFFGWRMR